MGIYGIKRLLAYLAGATIGVSSGAASAAQIGLVEIPEEILGAILDDVESDGWDTEDRMAVLSRLSADARPHVRRRVLNLLAQIGVSEPWEHIEQILDRLATNVTSADEAAVVRTLTELLSDTGGITRTRVASEWALDPALPKRRIIAKVLSVNFYCLGAASIAWYLAEDTSPDVRRAVVDLAEARFDEDPTQYSGILRTLERDAAPDIRHAAGQLLRQVDGGMELETFLGQDTLYAET